MEEKIKSPFAALYAPLPDVDAYLARIGYTGGRCADFPTLCSLMTCQLDAIPFENLDVFHGRLEPDLGTEALFDKLIRRRRGGYCFELNGLFWRLLEAMGFTCFCGVGRIALGRGYLTPPAHRVIFVEIDGIRYFCDVGFGGPIPASPLPMTEGVTHTCAAGRRYRFLRDGEEITLSVERDGEFVPMLIFDERPRDPVDFVPLNCFCARSPVQPFLGRQMIWRMAREGRRSIDGDLLRVTRNGVTEETVLATEAALREALLTHFGIDYPGELRLWR
jgi:N-hydroxyarylamine O-acetyltransferase